MEPHTSQSAFQKADWNFWFFEYRKENEEAPLPETQHTWKKYKFWKLDFKHSAL